MRDLLTTESQNCYKERIKKEMLTRLAWKGRYARLYPSSYNPGNNSTEQTQLPQLPANTRVVAHPVTREPEKQRNLPPSPPPPLPAVEGKQQLDVHLKRTVSPPTRQTLHHDSSHHGTGRSLYLKRRGHIVPEEKFDFPLLSSWEYGWRLGDFNLNYRTPSFARLSVVKSTFYSRNGVFNIPSATDTVE
ncbi:uncharacterized protein LOC121636396 [Melanotaenia boesemani]|uniref:uncharacterized protein LOC121636396 n=1 Tax=Melanotaenia boesemani TaxID=1250792 RepID=UPI001C03DBF5|nr:uncharacterized protein LOC121636396 [Melanotaenia boesemani]